eukprot:TRINITY_DN14689_c0_g1::TRINITY_DN14689_c0_g1_i1::g.21516::m.21516 TRINITY_DN14689_c0_g1::TRINITY_DN14689_c0_g1_i1::g.21516  ORF type:complete len:300 (+),score=84.04,Filamin/PF00630.14/5.5e-07,Filamin/PF00630.14/1.9,Filamin/PF00630.14/1.1,Big_3/PF07523.7/0.00075,Big_3/PF07523.7/12,Big_3/PF07523.7/1.6e+03,FlgD_ig/PF13860.1/0.61,FlgD_ig/PF13860.1/1.9e+02,Big_1/PF02369.11/0.86,Big_1/PF02369.11/65,Big_1/PF02369.11/1.6e+03,Big_1/PF02369.11/3.7e+02 TRINITY_DN14689_c0_g1_i1:732-1631(+)
MSFTIQTRDMYGNDRRTKSSGSFTVIAVDRFFNVLDLNDGTASFTLNITTVGTYGVTISYGSGGIQNSPFSVTISPGAANARTSVVYYPGYGNCISDSSCPTDLLEAGVVRYYYVQAKDVYSNSLVVGGSVVTFSLNGKNYEGLDQGTGQYKLGVFEQTSNTYAVTVKLGSVSISGSDFTVTVSPSVCYWSTSYTFVQVSSSQSSSCVTNQICSTLVAGVTSTFSIQAKDQYANTIHSIGGNGTYVYRVVGQDWYNASYVSDGKFSIGVQATLSGNYDVEVGLLYAASGDPPNFNIYTV